jgi:hypothetical protein
MICPSRFRGKQQKGTVMNMCAHSNTREASADGALLAAIHDLNSALGFFADFDVAVRHRGLSTYLAAGAEIERCAAAVAAEPARTPAGLAAKARAFQNYMGCPDSSDFASLDPVGALFASSTLADAAAIAA